MLTNCFNNVLSELKPKEKSRHDESGGEKSTEVIDLTNQAASVFIAKEPSTVTHISVLTAKEEEPIAIHESRQSTNQS